MAGLGVSGPIPQPDDTLARKRTRKGGDVKPLTVGERRPTRIPRADPQWHPIAKQLFNAVKRSGQSDFYQDSDWWLLYSLCEDLSVYKTPRHEEEDGTVWYGRRSGQMLQTIMSSMERLLITEGDRRRVRIELQEPVTPKPTLTLVGLDLYRDRLKSA